MRGEAYQPSQDLTCTPSEALPPSPSIMISHLNQVFTFNTLKMALPDLPILFSVSSFYNFP